MALTQQQQQQQQQLKQQQLKQQQLKQCPRQRSRQGSRQRPQE
jgi:hypothetical protein